MIQSEFQNPKNLWYTDGNTRQSVVTKQSPNGVFTPEQDNKTTTRQMLNLCIPIMPFTPDMSDLVWKAS